MGKYIPPSLYKGLWTSPDMIGGHHSHLNWRYIADRLHTLGGGDDGVAWDDFSVPLTRDKQGQNSKPDYDFTNNGLLFPYDDEAEIVYLTMQMQHQKKLDTAIRLHVHYIQSDVVKPIWKADYRWYNNGAAVPGSWTTIATLQGNQGVFTYTSGDMLQIATFAEIAPPANETISSNLDLRFYRNASAEGPQEDVLAKYIDFHYQIDGLGSDEEYTK